MLSSTPQPSDGKVKLEQVTQLLDRLNTDLDAEQLSSPQRKQLLEQLKVHGRSAANADPIFTENGIRTLSRYAFDTSDVQVSQEALRCLANALLLEPKTRQILVDLEYPPKAADKLKNDNIDDEFLTSRILFLMTYGTKLDYEKLVKDHQLAESINMALQRHSKRYEEGSGRQTETPMGLMALSETLKLLFNITHFNPGLSEHFSKSIPHIFKILLHRKMPIPPLQPPVNHLVNALLNLDLDDSKDQKMGSLGMNAVFPVSDSNCNAEHLVKILDKAIATYEEPELGNTVSPVLTLIRRIYEIAPESVQKHMEQLLLPSDDERNKPLGKSDTLSSRLLQLSSSALDETFRGSISSLMFELSGKDPAKFVHNVGYGFASGFLMSHNIEIPESALEASAAATSENGIPINPITGQRLDMEEPDESKPMTEEEKEREAERLFVLFERLKATGVVDVKNPVEEAFQSGRIEELEDDETD